MLVVVAYDINTEDKAGEKRLQHISNLCCRYGQRVQNSLFEMFINWSQFLEIKNKITECIDEKQDSVRIYLLGNDYKNKTIYLGKNKLIDVDKGNIII